MAGLAVARHRCDMMWLSPHGVIGTASRQVPDVCKHIVYACRTMSGRPDMAGRIFTHLYQIVYKFLDVVRQYRPSRQVATIIFYLYKMCAQNAWTCPAIPTVGAGQNNLSRQAVPQANQGFCSSHVVPLLCRVVSRIVATRTSRMSCTVILSFCLWKKYSENMCNKFA